MINLSLRFIFSVNFLYVIKRSADVRKAVIKIDHLAENQRKFSINLLLM